MFMVNGIKFNKGEGITVKTLLEGLKEDTRFSYTENFNGIVIINGKQVALTDLDSTMILEGDEIKIMPLIFGG